MRIIREQHLAPGKGIIEMYKDVDSIEKVNGVSVKDSFVKVFVKGKIEFSGDVLLLKKALLNGGATEVYLKEIGEKIEYGGDDKDVQLSLGIDESIKNYINGLDYDDEYKNKLLKYGMKILEQIR